MVRFEISWIFPIFSFSWGIHDFFRNSPDFPRNFPKLLPIYFGFRHPFGFLNIFLKKKFVQSIIYKFASIFCLRLTSGTLPSGSTVFGKVVVLINRSHLHVCFNFQDEILIFYRLSFSQLDLIGYRYPFNPLTKLQGTKNTFLLVADKHKSVIV